MSIGVTTRSEPDAEPLLDVGEERLPFWDVSAALALLGVMYLLTALLIRYTPY
jgi:hypothetical protein